jgi:hypothetical protein
MQQELQTLEGDKAQQAAEFRVLLEQEGEKVEALEAEIEVLVSRLHEQNDGAKVGIG